MTSKHLPNLPSDQLHFLSKVLSFFAISNKIVANNLSQNFMTKVTCSLEVQFFYGFQLMMENIHNETYSLLIDTYIKDKKMQNEIYNAIETIPTVGAKVKWAEMWCNSQHASFTKRLITFVVAEGIFFPFPSVPSFGLSNVKSVLPGLCFANELISHDEALHCDFACVPYNHLLKPRCSICIREIVDSAVQPNQRPLLLQSTSIQPHGYDCNPHEPIHLILC
jgi:ribonucleotide reductase beta subunit family protein with ferritin-like domain